MRVEMKVATVRMMAGRTVKMLAGNWVVPLGKSDERMAVARAVW